MKTASGRVPFAERFAAFLVQMLVTAQESRLARLSALGMEVPHYGESRSSGWQAEAGMR